MTHTKPGLIMAVLCLAALLLPAPLPAQITFQRTYGGAEWDNAFSGQQTTDGGYIMAGHTFSFGAGEDDIYLVKTDADGGTLWAKTYGGQREDRGYSVEQTADGGYIVAGETQSHGAGWSDVYLVKLDADGDTLWTRTFGGSNEDWGRSVQQTVDGGYIVAGHTRSFGAGQLDVYLIKTDANGDTLWTRTCGGRSDDDGWSVRQTADNGYIIAGWTGSFGAGEADIYLIKTDADGDTTWTRTFGGANFEEGYSVRQTADGGYVIAGTTMSFGAGSYDVYLVRTDAMGNAVWTRTFGGPEGDGGRSVQLTSDGGLVVAGSTGSFGAGGSDVYLIKTNANGDTLWTRTYGGADSDGSLWAHQTTDRGYITGGCTYSFGAGSYDFYLNKTDSLGRVGVEEPPTPPTRAPGLSLACEPNPCRGATTISFKPQTSRFKLGTLRVYDAQGRLVLSCPIRGSSLILQPSSLPAGAYFARLDCGSEHVTTLLVLQR